MSVAVLVARLLLAAMSAVAGVGKLLRRAETEASSPHLVKVRAG